MSADHQAGPEGREVTLPIRGNTNLQGVQALNDQIALANSTITDFASALQKVQKEHDEDKQTKRMQAMQIGYLLQEITTFRSDLVEVTDKYDTLEETYTLLKQEHETLKTEHADLKNQHETLKKKHDTVSLKLGTAEFSLDNMRRLLGIQPPSRRASRENESRVLTRIANKHSAQDSKINTLSQITTSQADKMEEMTRDSGKMANALVQVTCLLGQLNLNQITKEEAHAGYKSILDDMAAGEANESGPSLFSQPMEEVEVEEEILPETGSNVNV